MITHKRPPNKLLFSATLSQDPEKLQQLGLFHPKLFTSVVKSENQELTGKQAFILEYSKQHIYMYRNYYYFKIFRLSR